MVLVALTAVLVGTAVMLRTSESASMIAGNHAFRAAAVHAGELGINAGLSAVQALSNEEADQAPWYYATSQPVDAAGMPNTVIWSSVPSTALGNYQVQWVVERLCVAPLPVTDVYGQCQVSQTQQVASYRGGWGTALQSDPVKYYRVTTRITGPRGTEQYVQSLVSR